MVTGSKTTERRHKLRLELIDAAEDLLRAEGLAAVAARALAERAGCSVGAIYNVFEDIDEVIVSVNSRTLTRLDNTIAAFTPSANAAGDAEECLVKLAQAYCQFAVEHTNAWSALFEHGERINRDIPSWHLDEHVRLIGHIVKSLKRLMPATPDDELWQLAGLLFSAVHGVVSLGLQGFFFAVPQEQLVAQVKLLVQATLTGLQQTPSQ